MHGLYILWWVEEKNVSPAAVAAILAAGDLVLAAIELPTGWFADRYGHRLSLVAGSLVQIGGMLWCWLGEGIPALLTASVLVALGDAFRSGADQALLYRSCVILDREDEFQRIEARTQAIGQTVLVAQVLAGGAIVSVWGFAAGWIAETLLCSVGLVLACALTEPPAAAQRSGDGEGAAERRAVPAGLTATLWRLAPVIAPAALLGGFAGAAVFIVQSTMAAPWAAALAVAGITLCEAAGAAGAARMRNAGARGQIVLLVTGAVIAAAGALVPRFLPAAACALSLLVGIAGPLRATAIQRLAGDGVRARAASAASLADMIVSTLTLPVAGLWRAR